MLRVEEELRHQRADQDRPGADGQALRGCQQAFWNHAGGDEPALRGDEAYRPLYDVVLYHHFWLWAVSSWPYTSCDP